MKDTSSLAKLAVLLIDLRVDVHIYDDCDGQERVLVVGGEGNCYR